MVCRVTGYFFAFMTFLSLAVGWGMAVEASLSEPNAETLAAMSQDSSGGDGLPSVSQAQPTVDIASWAYLAISTGFGGLSWWLITKGIPEKDKQADERINRREQAWQAEMEAARAEAKASRLQFSAELAAMRDKGTAEMQREREMFERTIAAIMAGKFNHPST